jgi:hypothetical protein
LPLGYVALGFANPQIGVKVGAPARSTSFYKNMYTYFSCGKYIYYVLRKNTHGKLYANTQIDVLAYNKRHLARFETDPVHYEDPDQPMKLFLSAIKIGANVMNTFLTII